MRNIQAATAWVPTTVTIQRRGVLETSSLTERTRPVTVEPFSLNEALWP